MTDRKVSTSGTRGIGDGMEGVEDSLGLEGVPAAAEDHLLWTRRAGVAMLGRRSSPIADWIRRDFILDLVQVLELFMIFVQAYACAGRS